MSIVGHTAVFTKRMLARLTSLRKVSTPRNLLKVTNGGFRNASASGSGNNATEGSSFRGPVTYTSLALMALIGGGILVYYNTQKEENLKKVASKVTTVGKAALGGPWILIDENGTPVSDAHYRGKFLLLYFGFTHCPDICPSELVKIGKIMDGLGNFVFLHNVTNILSSSIITIERRILTSLKPIFISVDPARDTIGQLKLYGRDFHKDITYLTGASGQVAAAAKAYRVYFSKVYSAYLYYLNTVF